MSTDFVSKGSWRPVSQSVLNNLWGGEMETMSEMKKKVEKGMK